MNLVSPSVSSPCTSLPGPSLSSPGSAAQLSVCFEGALFVPYGIPELFTNKTLLLPMAFLCYIEETVYLLSLLGPLSLSVTRVISFIKVFV